jgi:hypothetical protein
MDWTLRSGNDPVTVPKTGHPATVSLALDMAPDILKPGYFSNLTCVAQAVH